MQMAGDIAICIYYALIDPFTGQEVYVARGLRDRKTQRALMPFFKPENDFFVLSPFFSSDRYLSFAGSATQLASERIKPKYRRASNLPSDQ
jgi:hypothetical protein